MFKLIITQNTILNTNINSKTVCNCHISEICLLNETYLTDNVLYKASISYVKREKFYFGLTQNSFKT